MPKTEKRQMPILGITWSEERNGETKEETKHAGPCMECGEIDWLSSKRDQWICHQCWYGPGSQRDPITDDIHGHVVSTWYRLADEVLAIIEEHEQDRHTITGTLAEDVEKVICPHCIEEVDHCTLTPLGSWACPGCIENFIQEMEVLY